MNHLTPLCSWCCQAGRAGKGSCKNELKTRNRRGRKGQQKCSASGDNGTDFANPQTGPCYMVLFWLRKGKMSLLQWTTGHVSVTYGIIRSSSHWNWELWDFSQPALRRQFSSSEKFLLKRWGPVLAFFKLGHVKSLFVHFWSIKVGMSYDSTCCFVEAWS